MDISIRLVHLYDTFSSPSEALTFAKQLAIRFRIYTIVEGCCVMLVDTHRESSLYSGFAAAWEEGEKRRGSWNEELVQEVRIANETTEADRESQRHYEMSQEEYYRETLLSISKHDPPYKLRED